MATIDGGAGDDSLAGTSGSDTLTALAGNDTVLAGAGSDSLWGGAGNDLLYGGDGSDTLMGEAGDDSLDGGADNDSIVAGLGDDRVQAGLGEDTLYGDEGADSLQADAGNDLVFAGAGNDSLYGGADDDTLYGGTNDDLALGGDGNDLIYGQEDNDTVGGGAGDDRLYGGQGADVFVTGAGAGVEVIEDYTPGDGDLIAIDYPGITSFSQLQPLMSDDGAYGTLITFPDGGVTQIRWTAPIHLSSANFVFGAGPVCFLGGTKIDTDRGPRPVQELAPGDLVLTRDHGLLPLLHLCRATWRFRPGPHRMKPIRLAPGALDSGLPACELIVSPQHRIAWPPLEPRALVPARHLLGLEGVSQRPGCLRARYFHLLLPCHALVRANGAWAESLLVTEAGPRIPFLPRGLAPVPMAPALPLVRATWQAEAPPLGLPPEPRLVQDDRAPA
ncbi:Hint domain-containing protein [Stagnihabitans tardus]|uniref:Hedgehog/Intein (Hint) domain-containing protein n=1 Tax=Stagnihabitans tardus TaxID=2699202 RepID=A0AAE5BTC6_9RHOB|nr:Hint domain-containing protein [Stagnihabitans tardus]NBZ86541.1 hypothetical protein [Stagnihabitans tardus]